ncbi:FAD-dependent oxidoreductase [Sphingorhabdus lutea]|uniref:Pyridine nucleotide-disulfide oxidoreductase domain-containing protein 2 n=1 Tax=Sphingorhabdus lutea TaxID=1913578 RepID=A0A1L3J9T1_9SPHN|nr:NAD(P)/FAD-dependent oxidoreductase [Sphingorhabdus lutea]APG61878.1 FAD-dependent oxidoreductase [Sphingorhabdus lutea]
MPVQYDAIIIGGGHNGLVCAYYLAKSGMKVRIVEARGIVGGCAVTEEFHPGFRNSVASYTVSLLQPKIIADMQLVRRGYRVVERPFSNYFPLPDGGHMLVGGGVERTQAEFARFNKSDAAKLPEFYAMLENVADLLRSLAMQPPPDINGGLSALFDLGRTLWPMRDLSVKQKNEITHLFTRSARDILDGWFENEHIKAAFAFDSIVGNYASPDTPGSGYVLIHHVFGEVNGNKGSWGHVIGGMGAITQMMAAACEEAGVEISLNSPVTEILYDENRAHSVKLLDGQIIKASHIISNVGPKLLAKLVGKQAGTDWPVKDYKSGSGSFRMNVALSALPKFTGMPEQGDHLKSGIIIAPTMDYMDRAFHDARAYGWSKSPIIEMLIPSLVDDSLSPKGQHVASLFCQQFASHLPDGRVWTDKEEEAAADHIIATINKYAPGFSDLILGRMILSPAGLEAKFGLIDGDIFHGRMSLDQIWINRPWMGAGNYHMPLKGLYLCGSGAHPGGGVTGAPGYLCAQQILSGRKIMNRIKRRFTARD